MARKKKRQIRALFMLGTLVISTIIPLLVGLPIQVEAESTEAGGNDYCYVNVTDESGDDGTGVAPSDKVLTVPIKVKDENATGKAAMKEIADAIGKKLHIKPALVYAQMCQEAGPNGDSVLARQSKNFSGIKGSGGGIPTDGTGGEYQKFNTLSEYASRFAGILKNDGLENTNTPEDYVHKLKQMNYFTADEGSYLAGVKALMAGYYGDNPNGAGDAAGSGADSDSDSSKSGSWHKGDDDFAPDSLDTDFTQGFGDGSSGNQEDDSDTSGTDQVGGDWTQKGTPAYKNAKAIFDFLTKKMGFSGAGAAGAVGNAFAESGFNPKAKNPGGNVTGIFQWSSGGINGDRLHQGNFIKSDDDLTMENELKLTKYELDGSLASVKKSVGHATNPTDAAMDWVNNYERAPGQNEEGRKAAAVTAYKLFNGSSIKANDSLLGSGASDAANAGASSDSSSSSDNSSACSGQESSGKAGDWDWPFDDFNPDKDISSPFGMRDLGGSQFHDGIDIGLTSVSGKKIKAMHGGKVIKIDHEGYTQNDLGYYVIVKSPDGYYEIYQEFTFYDDDAQKDIKVKEGDTVNTGDEIGTMDPNAKNCTHIHVGICKGATMEESIAHSFDPNWKAWKDPVKVIKGENTDQK